MEQLIYICTNALSISSPERNVRVWIYCVLVLLRKSFWVKFQGIWPESWVPVEAKNGEQDALPFPQGEVRPRNCVGLATPTVKSRRWWVQAQRFYVLIIISTHNLHEILTIIYVSSQLPLMTMSMYFKAWRPS